MRKDKIKFKLVNNLIVVPVEVNGTELSFLLDTGVKSSIIFSLEQRDSITLGKSKPITLKGLGGGEPIEALRSEKNKVRLGKAFDNDHSLYVVFGSSLNLSPRMGIPIHGIIGYEFFKNFVVKVNYAGNRLTFYNPDTYQYRKCRRCVDLDMGFYADKPYVEISIFNLMDREQEALLLLDSGSSDAIWLFDTAGYLEEDASNYFKDYLGLGLSGDIYGKRSKINKISIGRYDLSNVNVSFPNKMRLHENVFFEDRDGSLGGDLLRRFTVWIDYQNRSLRLRRNRSFNDPFHYNMSGLTVEHDGMDVIEETVSKLEGNSSLNNKYNIRGQSTDILQDLVKEVRFRLVPNYVVSAVRPDSPADRSGILKGDEIIEVNGKVVHKMELYELNTLFTSEEGKKLRFKLRRNGMEFEVKFELERIL
ncbi:aspartyl protease family protein [Flavobacteriaceae bacterium TK19130]|nr:aspartyl protease family protein [Thermobacterium salinum]